MKKVFYIYSALLIILSSCSGSLDLVIGQSHIMTFEANAGHMTKVSDNSFTDGDAIGIFVTEYQDDSPKAIQVSGNYVNNEQASFNGSVWKTANTLYWPADKCDVYAYYPYVSVPASITKDSFCIQTDQSAGIGQSDFLWAKASSQSYDSENPSAAVVLNFHHKMSKLVLKLVKGSDYVGDLPSDAIFYVHSTVPNCTIDYSTGSATKDGHSSSQSITCHKVSDDTYEAIIVPQRISSRSPLIEMVSKGVSYLAEGTFNFKPGVVHTFTVTLNTSTEAIRIDIGGEVENWN